MSIIIKHNFITSELSKREREKFRNHYLEEIILRDKYVNT